MRVVRNSYLRAFDLSSSFQPNAGDMLSGAVWGNRPSLASKLLNRGHRSVPEAACALPSLNNQRSRCPRGE